MKETKITTFKFREHRGLLEDSMKTVVDLPASTDALARHLGVEASRIEVKPYVYDDRINWDTHIVTMDGQAVGFTNGPLAILGYKGQTFP